MLQRASRIGWHMLLSVCIGLYAMDGLYPLVCIYCWRGMLLSMYRDMLVREMELHQRCAEALDRASLP